MRFDVQVKNKLEVFVTLVSSTRFPVSSQILAIPSVLYHISLLPPLVPFSSFVFVLDHTHHCPLTYFLSLTLSASLYRLLLCTHSIKSYTNTVFQILMRIQ